MRTPYLVTTMDGGISQLDYLSSVTEKQISTLNHSTVAFWVIDAREKAEATHLIQAIRGTEQPSIYLKPIVFLTDETAIGSTFVLRADTYCTAYSFNPRAAEKYIIEFEQINQWIDALPNSNNKDTNISFKILRFIASRDKEFIPVLSATDMTGFIYPQLQPFFHHRDIGLFQTIEFLHSQNLLTSHFFKNAHFCRQCDCAFLIFEEICPHCSANDLHLDELVHHFKCAYTGELASFKQDDNLVCPKCDRTLRHIGVDYDKPSTIYRCNHCAHTFQEPEVTSTCYNCGHTTQPENQTLRSIRSYCINSIGNNAAQYGMESLFSNIMETEMKLIPLNSFNDFYRIEAARIKRYKKSVSSLVLLSFDNLEELYIKLGNQAQYIFVELSTVLKSVLRSSDLITARNESIFIIIMTETDSKSAERAIERLQEGISKLFENNLAYTPTLVTKTQEIGPESNPEELLEQFL